MRITVHNRGPERADLHVLPQLWFRNTWSWGYPTVKPSLSLDGDHVVTRDGRLGAYHLYGNRRVVALHRKRTNGVRLFGQPGPVGYVKDAFHAHVVDGHAGAVDPSQRGTKAAAHHRLSIPAASSAVVRLRLSSNTQSAPFAHFLINGSTCARRSRRLYESIQSGLSAADQRLVQRQALAGMIWSKQFFYYDVPQWLQGDPGQPLPPAERARGRNHDWQHLNNADVISMPDKWEYPGTQPGIWPSHGGLRAGRPSLRETPTAPAHP